MFQDLFVPGETAYNRETERNIATAILDRHLELLQAMLATCYWCLKDGTAGPLPETILDGTETNLEWYRREGREWYDRYIHQPITSEREDTRR